MTAAIVTRGSPKRPDNLSARRPTLTAVVCGVTLAVSGCDSQDAFAAPIGCRVVVAGYPIEAPGGDQHYAQTVVERELQRFRDAVLGRFAYGFEAETVTVEGERCLPVGDRQAHNDGVGGRHCAVS
jgi:hypothetical protein